MLKHYRSANDYFRELFGCKVYKLALSCSDTCPNRDGTVGTGGCIFCGAEGSGEFAEICKNSSDLESAIAHAKKRVSSKTNGGSYIAYFQSFTSTYAPISRLEELFTAATERNDIVALSVATRPDCLSDSIMNLLKRISERKPLFVELGLQTIHETTAKSLNRGYALNVYDTAVDRLHKINANIITHIILGLPGESSEMVEQTAKYVGKVTDGIKLQLMFVLKNTVLADMYYNGKYKPLTLEEYSDMLCRCIEILPPNVVIHRLTGDPPKRIMIAPEWAADKKRVLNHISSEFERRDILQGKYFH